jgi:small-conductance mechanosensitive channel
MARKIFIIIKTLFFGLLVYLRAQELPFEKDLSRFFHFTSKLESFVTVAINFLIFALGFNLLLIFLSFFYRRKQNLKYGKRDNVIIGLDNIYILVMSVAIVVTLISLFGVDPKSLFTGLSIVAAAIAIITRDFIANIIAGIAISFSDEISIGDYVKIGNYKGSVTDITISRLALLNDDDDLIFIPNNTVTDSEVINYTKKGIRKVNIEFEMKIEYLDTIEHLENDLIESLEDYRPYIEDNSFRLKIVEILKDSLHLKFNFVLHEVNPEMEKQIRKKTARKLVNYLRRDNGISDQRTEA